MKNIDAIIRGSKTFVDKLFSITKNKVMRAVESSFDKIDENIYNEEVKKVKALQSLADAADSSVAMSDAFSRYHEACNAIREWEAFKTDMQALKDELEAEAPEEEK